MRLARFTAPEYIRIQYVRIFRVHMATASLSPGECWEVFVKDEIFSRRYTQQHWGNARRKVNLKIGDGFNFPIRVFHFLRSCSELLPARLGIRSVSVTLPCDAVNRYSIVTRISP